MCRRPQLLYVYESTVVYKRCCLASSPPDPLTLPQGSPSNVWTVCDIDVPFWLNIPWLIVLCIMPLLELTSREHLLSTERACFCFVNMNLVHFACIQSLKALASSLPTQFVLIPFLISLSDYSTVDRIFLSIFISLLDVQYWEYNVF